MKRPLSWHCECLKNSMSHLESEKRMLARKAADVDELEKRVNFYKAQIEAARSKGLEDFDCEKFHHKRTPKEPKK